MKMPGSLAARCQEYDFNAGPPPIVTIYFLIADEEIVYIGRTTTALAARLNGHRAWPDERKFDRVLWFTVAFDDGPAYEGAFIRRFAPEGCTYAPSGGERDVEILALFGLKPDPDALARYRVRRGATHRQTLAELRARTGAKPTPKRERLTQRARAHRLWSAVDVLLHRNTSAS